MRRQGVRWDDEDQECVKTFSVAPPPLTIGRVYLTPLQPRFDPSRKKRGKRGRGACKAGGPCSIEHMRYFKQLFAFFTRGRPRHEQLQLPFHVKASRRAALLQPAAGPARKP